MDKSEDASIDAGMFERIFRAGRIKRISVVPWQKVEVCDCPNCSCEDCADCLCKLCSCDKCDHNRGSTEHGGKQVVGP